MSFPNRIPVRLTAMKVCAAVLSIILILGHSVFAEPTVNVEPQNDYRNISNKLTYLIGADSKLEPPTALGKNSNLAWQSNTVNNVNLGFESRVVWFKLHLRNSHEHEVEKLLRFTYPFLDSLEIWIDSQVGMTGPIRLGDKFHFDTRIYDDPTFIVPLMFPPGDKKTLLIRVETSTALQFQLELWNRDHFVSVSQKQVFIHGIFVGLFCMALFYNLFLYINSGDRNYLAYCIYVLILIGLQAALLGRGFQFLWFNNIWLQERAVTIFLAGAYVSLCYFTILFLDLKKAKRWQEKSMKGIFFLAIALFLLSLTAPVLWVLPVLIAACAVSTCYSIIVGYTRWRDGYQPASYYTIAFSFYTFGSLIKALSLFGVLPVNSLTNNGFYLGNLMEVILLSFGLGFRARVIQKEHNTLRKRLTEKLELEVYKKTQELQESHQRLEALNKQLERHATTDALTNLKNRRYFDVLLKKQLLVCSTKPSPLSLILIDIDHFKKFNDTYGHRIGDECLRYTAEVIAGSATGSDQFAARIGGEEFAVVLPHIDEKLALEIATHILHDIRSNAIHFEDEVFKLTVSIGVTTCHAHQKSSMNLEAVVDDADKALYWAKDAGRDCIIVNNAKTRKATNYYRNLANLNN